MKRIFLLSTFIFSITCISAQERSQQPIFNQIYLAAEKEYGIHQELVNGVLFEKKNQDAIGHPYYMDYYSHPGSVVYRGKEYKDLLLKYDIYDQQVQLLYEFDTFDCRIYLKKEFISEMTIDDKKFIHKSFDAESDVKFYQVIGEDLPVQILYYWTKGLTKLDKYIPNKNYIFSEDVKNTYLLLNYDLVQYRGNRSFSRIFSSRRKTSIKEYFRKHKLKVKKAEGQEMEKLIFFINSLDP